MTFCLNKHGALIKSNIFFTFILNSLFFLALNSFRKIEFKIAFSLLKSYSLNKA